MGYTWAVFIGKINENENDDDDGKNTPRASIAQ
jgi:hypothetical protein